MKELVRYDLDSGSALFLEVDDCGIRLKAKVGAVIAASEGEGYFQVKLT